MKHPQRRLVLASGSRFRRELLGRLGLRFETAAPKVDEKELPGENAAELAGRLATTKATAIDAHPALVIGSDQAPSLDGRILRKPGGHTAAVEQLLACQGRTVTFYTAVCLVDTGSGRRWHHIDTTHVHFACLPRTAIERYVTLERPFDSAGGFKAESLGIVLFDRIESSDPTGLIGLPLIGLSAMLRVAGIDPLE